MVVRIVRLGTERLEGEGIRVGTVRPPPRGVPKAQFSAQNWYDGCYPKLAPTVETMKLGQEALTLMDWATFTKKYRSEMSATEASHSLELLAALSKTSDFSVGCYCEGEEHWHRSILRALLEEKGAAIS